MLRYLLFLVLIPLTLTMVGCERRIATEPSPYSPYDLSATAISSEEIELAWNDNSLDEKGFYVYRKDNGDYRRIAALDANTTFYLDSNLDPQTTYWYRVSSYNDGGESGLSNEALATTMVEVEIVDYWMEKDTRHDYWYTTIVGYIRNNTKEILNVWVVGEFYKGDKWIAMEKSLVTDVNPGRKTKFHIQHSGKTEITRITIFIQEYY